MLLPDTLSVWRGHISDKNTCVPSRVCPVSLCWIFRYEQPGSDGGPLRNRRTGVGCQQLPQRCKPRPQHRLQPQFRGEWTSGPFSGTLASVASKLNRFSQKVFGFKKLVAPKRINVTKKIRLNSDFISDFFLAVLSQNFEIFWKIWKWNYD